MSKTRKVDIPAVLDGAFVRTRTVLWEATSYERLECAMCEQIIPKGDLFTKAKVPGYGHANLPQCRACRPFTVLYDELRSSLAAAREAGT